MLSVGSDNFLFFSKDDIDQLFVLLVEDLEIFFTLGLEVLDVFLGLIEAWARSIEIQVASSAVEVQLAIILLVALSSLEIDRISKVVISLVKGGLVHVINLLSGDSIRWDELLGSIDNIFHVAISHIGLLELLLLHILLLLVLLRIIKEALLGLGLAIRAHSLVKRALSLEEVSLSRLHVLVVIEIVLVSLELIRILRLGLGGGLNRHGETRLGVLGIHEVGLVVHIHVVHSLVAKTIGHVHVVHIVHVIYVVHAIHVVIVVHVVKEPISLGVIHHIIILDHIPH